MTPDNMDVVAWRFRSKDGYGDWSHSSDEPPLWFKALAEVLRPRSIILLAVMAGVLSLFWIA